MPIFKIRNPFKKITNYLFSPTSENEEEIKDEVDSELNESTVTNQVTNQVTNHHQ